MEKCPKCGKDLKDQDGPQVCDSCGYKEKKIKDAHESFNDVRDILWDESTRKLEATPEGFLVGVAALTSIGIFPYRQPDGSIRRDLRLPEEVFNPKSLATLKMKPVTKQHPTDEVSKENVKAHQVGNTGSNIFHDPYTVYGDLTIQDVDAVKAVTSKELVALSCGYDARLDFTPGTIWGQDYDCIHRDIVYNHLALVKKGRAGDSIVLRLDSADNTDINNPSRSKSMKKLILDHAQFEVDDTVHEHFVRLSAKADKLESEKAGILKDSADQLSAEKAKNEALSAQVEALKADKAKMQDTSPEAIQKAVTARLALLGAAKSVGVESLKDTASDDELRVAVVSKVFPTVSLEGKDAAHIQVMFDAAMDIHNANVSVEETNNNNTREFKADSSSNSHLSKSEQARQRMIDDMNGKSAQKGV